MNPEDFSSEALSELMIELFGKTSIPHLTKEERAILLMKISKEKSNKTMGHLPVPNYTSKGPLKLLLPHIYETKEISSNEATPENTYWVTKDGKRIRVSEMSTVHIYNALVLLYTKMVDLKYRIHMVKNKQKTVVKGGQEKDALHVFFIEIAKPSRENDLTEKMLEELALMQDVVTRKLN